MSHTPHTHAYTHPPTHTLCRWKGSGEAEKGFDKSTGIVRVEVDPKYYRPTEVVSVQYSSSHGDGHNVSYCVILGLLTR